MDDSPVHRLPVETWTDIAITLRNSYPCGHDSIIDDDSCPTPYCSLGRKYHSVGPLTQTCRYLYTAIQPILFEFISRALRPPDRNAEKMRNLESTLADRRDLQLAVRALCLSGRRGSQFPKDLSDGIRHILPQLMQLRHLSLAYVKLDSTITQFLLNATLLHSMKLFHCDWSEDVAQDWAVNGTFGRNLRYLYLETNIFLNKHRNFQLFVPSLTELAAHGDVASQYLQISATAPFGASLTKLCISHWNSNSDILERFVSQCPNVEHLKVAGSYDELDVGLDFLPKLRCLEGDASLTKVLLPGRPGRRLAIERASPEIFARPLPNLEELDLEFTNERERASMVISLVLANCSGLVKLGIRCYDEPTQNIIKGWIASRLVSEIAALPKLQVLQIKMKYPGPPNSSPLEYPLSEEILQERELVTRMKKEHCQDLHEVRVHLERAWAYVRADDTWVPKERNMR